MTPKPTAETLVVLTERVADLGDLFDVYLMRHDGLKEQDPGVYKLVKDVSYSLWEFYQKARKARVQLGKEQ